MLQFITKTQAIVFYASPCETKEFLHQPLLQNGKNSFAPINKGQLLQEKDRNWGRYIVFNFCRVELEEERRTVIVREAYFYIGFDLEY